MKEQKIIKLLKDNGLRKTEVRIKVLNAFLESDQAYGQGALEAQFENLDRITLYRTLRTFEQKGIIHQAIDGSGKTKYAICTDSCTEHQHYDHHAHFHCKACDKTICLEEIEVPKIETPSKYKVEQSHLVLRGLCEDCQE
ncbi:MAG: transcriptional repressor [Bacteroidota bacterium]